MSDGIRIQTMNVLGWWHFGVKPQLITGGVPLKILPGSGVPPDDRLRAFGPEKASVLKMRLLHAGSWGSKRMSSIGR